MILKSTSATVKGKRGTIEPVTRPLVTGGSTPSGGWSSSVTVNGTNIILNGGTPDKVVSKLKELVLANNLDYVDADLWLTLNVDWVQRSVESNRKVATDDLAKIISNDLPDKNFRGAYPALEWAPSYLDHLGIYLGVDAGRYNFSHVKSAHAMFLQVATPSMSYRTGDMALSKILMDHDRELRMRPKFRIGEARSWFFTLYSDIASLLRLPQQTPSELQTKYHW